MGSPPQATVVDRVAAARAKRTAVRMDWDMVVDLLPGFEAGGVPTIKSMKSRDSSVGAHEHVAD